MSRIIDVEYYIPVAISYLIKIGEIKQPSVKHSDPADYGLTREQAIKLRIKYLREKREVIQEKCDEVKKEMLSGTRPYGYIMQNYYNELIEKLDKDINYNLARLRTDTDKPSYDLETIKRIPLDQITKINSNGFFQDNPFRSEKSPSNSLHWDKKSNRWHDFGSGQHGDVIDLVMVIENCDFKTALKELSNLI
jgi:hypothetical protein